MECWRSCCSSSPMRTSEAVGPRADQGSRWPMMEMRMGRYSRLHVRIRVTAEPNYWIGMLYSGYSS